MDEQTEKPADITSNDIVFECPHCGKSLAIESRGAGLIIVCPDCQQRIQVPLADEETELIDQDADTVTDLSAEQVRTLRDALAASQSKVEQLVSTVAELRERRRRLEKTRADNAARCEIIGRELQAIQSSIDRMIGVLQDAAAEKEPEENEEGG